MTDAKGIEISVVAILVVGFLIAAFFCSVGWDAPRPYWEKPLIWDAKPLEGQRIKITYLSPCRNAPNCENPYIGMEGVVHYEADGKFSIKTDNSWLVNIDKCKYETISV